MTKVFYVGDDAWKNGEDDHVVPKQITKSWLEDKCRKLDISASVEHRRNDSIVKVMDHVGSGQFLANGMQDMIWLRSISEKTERHGSVMWYFVKRDDN